MNCEFVHNILHVETGNFERIALDVFYYQYRNNAVYRQFTNLLNVDVVKVDRISRIPFLPISFFKGHEVTSGEFSPACIFESSGTLGQTRSRHLVKELQLYRESFIASFRLFYGNPENWCVIGLLPSYLERQHSSLIFMVDELIRMSGNPQSGFYLDDHAKLSRALRDRDDSGRKTLLIGVTFALLDFAVNYPMKLSNTVVMETGGMKGRREEMTRQQVHSLLKEQLGLSAMHAEYGMTELLSQAYASAEGIFRFPPWAQALVREEDDPLAVKSAADLEPGAPASGVLNIIDLANIHSCAFLATEDVGRLYANGSFEVLGRMDNSEMRGCSLLVI